MKKAVLILALLLCNLLYGEEVKTVESIGEAILGGDKSIEQVKEEALSLARKSAIEYVSGVELNSNSLVKDSALFYSFINTRTKGRIVKEEIKKWETEKAGVDKDGLPITLYRVKIRADVKEENGIKKDNLFSIKAELNRNNFVNGEKAELKIFTTKKCYVTIFNLYGNNSADIIFPNEFDKIGEAAENGILNFPQQGTSFELYTPEDKRESKELIYIVAVKEYIDFKKMLGEKTTIENVNRIISDIDDKAEYMIGYIVRNK